MNLSSPFIRRPVMTILVMISIFLAGIMAYRQLPVSNLPNVDYPAISVSASLVGASPEMMANSVATPLEREFMTISGLSEITSSSSLGLTSITLIFDIDKNIDSAALDVQAAIARATPNLPILSNGPIYQKLNPSTSPIIYIALVSDVVSKADLYTYGNTFIGQRLASLNGVAQVLTFGSPYAVRVQVNPNELANLGITLQDVAAALRTGSVNIPNGQINGPSVSSLIMTKGQLNNAAEFQPLVITYRNNAPVRIQDVGQAIDSVKVNTSSLRYIDKDKNQESVVIAVKRQPGANTVAVVDAIEKYLPILAEQLPPSIEMKVIFNHASSIKASIADVEFTLLLAFFLVVLVLFIYLGQISETIIPAIVLPMSVLGTFIIMNWLGYSLDNLSLLALTLSTGFIVDDAIVVLESIVRKVEEGHNRLDAALEGSKQISLTILTTTLSIVAVLIPLLFMTGLIGKLFREFAVTLVVVNLASLFFAITLTPMLCSLLLSRNKTKLTIFQSFSNWFNRRMLAFYEPVLRWSLSHKKITLLAGVLSIVLSVILLTQLKADFLPEEDIGFVIAYNQAEEGTSSDKMLAYQNAFIEIMQQDPNIESFISMAASPQYRSGTSFIRLKPHEMRKPVSEVIQGFYAKTANIPGINSFFMNIPLIELSIGSESKGAYQYSLQGINDKDLYASAEKLMEKMKKNPIFQGVSSDLEIKTPQLTIEILHNQAAALGITSQQIQEAFLLGYSGGAVSKIQSSIDQYDLILELQEQYQKQVSSLSSIYLRSSLTNQVVPLSTLVKWKEEIGVASINHVSQFPAITVSFNIMPGIPLSTALSDLKKISEETLSSGVNGSVKGVAEAFQESVNTAGYLLLLAIFAIYLVLGILYESFIHPLTILSSLPPAILGALATLYIFNLPLSLYSFLGIILLVGVVQKNGIMMVDYALENIRSKGETPEKSIYEACVVRFRPIMMTTLTTMAGALPIALGFGFSGAARSPLGLVIIGGLIVSQCITLLLTPVVYLYMEKLRSKA